MALGGGTTRLWRPTYPTSVGASLALLIDLPQPDLGVPHNIAVAIQGPDEPVGEVTGRLQVSGTADLKAGESVVTPVAIDLRPVQLPSEGSYSINISIDGEFMRTVGFVAQPPGAQPT